MRAARRRKLRLRRAIARELRALAILHLRRQLELDLLQDSLRIRVQRLERLCTVGWDQARRARELGPLRDEAAALRSRFTTYRAELREAELLALRRLGITPYSWTRTTAQGSR